MASEGLDPTTNTNLALLGLDPEYGDYPTNNEDLERPDRGVHHSPSLHLPAPPYYNQPDPHAYHAPAPHTAYHAPAPSYNQNPSHNCSVEDEVLTAEICTPTYTTSCGPVSVKGTKLGEREQCVDIRRTVCTTGVENTDVEVCVVEYEPRVHQVDAVTVQVKFSKECNKQMVTVCQPQPAYSAGSYHTVQHCKEVCAHTK